MEVAPPRGSEAATFVRSPLEPTFDDRLRRLFDEAEDEASERCLSWVSALLAESPSAELSLVGLERLLRAVPDRRELFWQLLHAPRAVEVLLKVFAASPFLTDILLREPGLLSQLTQPQLLRDLRSRPEFAEAALLQMKSSHEPLTALREFQHGELLRIGVCDFLGLFDLRSITNQLSLLADAIVQVALELVGASPPHPDPLPRCGGEGEKKVLPLAILALGKLGGEELNYSSDIDLVFVCEGDAAAWQEVAQRLSKVLSDVTSHGFLYRVDVRLRAWGNAGPLVVSIETYLDYLRQHAQQWERQALLKARVIAGDFTVGQRFLEQARPLIFGASADDVRRSVLLAKKRIEQDLQRKGKGAGEVKLGAGTIRDIEFVVQCLQLQHGREVPDVRSANTLDGLVRLAELGFVQADEYRELSSAYLLFRVIEHALQLKHSRQTHSLPSDPIELEVLARRLDFSSAEQLTTHFQQHRAAVRRIFDKYVGGTSGVVTQPAASEGSETAKPMRPAMDRRRRQRTWEHLSDETPLIVEWRAIDEPQEELADRTNVAASLPRGGANAFDSQFQNRAPLDTAPPRGSEAAMLSDSTPAAATKSEVTIAGFDQLGDLSMMCGLLFVHGFDIVEGDAFTEVGAAGHARPLRFENSFLVRRRVEHVSNVLDDGTLKTCPTALHRELLDLLNQARGGRRREAQAKLAKRVSEALPTARPGGGVQSPVEIDFDNDSHPHMTTIRITAEDTSGFLYELTNALALLSIDIRQMEIRTDGSRVRDTLLVTDDSGRKLFDEHRQQVLRTAVVLIQHFTSLLPQSPNPEAALLHFQELLERELLEPDWLSRLASLRRPEVLAALAKLLGVSDLLWEDFLRLQHANVFPVVTDIEGLQLHKSRATLAAELAAELSACSTTNGSPTPCGSVDSSPTIDPPGHKGLGYGDSKLVLRIPFAESCRRLNAFKDREMFRIDMRQITGLVPEFMAFAGELTNLAEAVIAAACELAEREARARTQDAAVTFCVAALGKLGGRELGFASDIELLFVFDGPAPSEFCERLVELFQQSIVAKRAGIFQIDLRLRPHGRAGSLAVSLDEFTRYFAADGPAWPFERQSLIKLRPIAGNAALGETLLRRRDELLFGPVRWEVASVRAMRERQVRQHVQAGTFHAKLSAGALVDVEYLVQLLQLSLGERHSSLRVPGTLDALTALAQTKLIPDAADTSLRAAYLFFRRLIDALRMSRGAADDLTLPPADSEEITSLARRLNLTPAELTQLAEQHAADTRAWGWTLGWPISPA